MHIKPSIRRALLILGTACCLAAGIPGAPAFAAANSPNLVKSGQGGQLRLVGAPAQGQAIRIPDISQTSSLSQAAIAAATRYGPSFGLAEAARELAVSRQGSRPSGGSHVRLQQYHLGVPVIGGELLVNLDKSKRLVSMTGEVSSGLSVPVTPLISRDQARKTALHLTSRLRGLEASKLHASQPSLSIYDPKLIGPGSGDPVLVWKSEVRADGDYPVREFVLIDATSGRAVLNFSMINHARNRATYDGALLQYLPGTLMCAEAADDCTGGTTADADDAHEFAGHTYDYFYSNHGRDSFDGLGATLISTVRYREATEDPVTPSAPYDNAYWSGNQMVYGEGYSAADDVVAHELTHAVTEYSSNLFYYYQSGAINESLSDLWGEFVDQTNAAGNDSGGVKWLIGEDLAGGAFRSMSDPTVYSHPDKMSSPHYDFDYGIADQGGVHANSGINNKAVFLMTDGGSFSGKIVTGIGLPKVGAIYYEAQTSLLSSGANYQDLYAALNQACINLTGGDAGVTASDCQQVKMALDAVEMNTEPNDGASFAPQASHCSTGIRSVPIFNDTMESTTKFVSATEGGLANPWYLWEYYATGGVSALTADDVDWASDSVAVMSSAVTIPAGGAFLHFRHAFDLDGYFDGGVLEYSANGGAWTDAKTAGLFSAGQNYTGTLEGTQGLEGRQAFSGDSHGYVSSRYNLVILAGMSVKFRFRLGTDTSNPFALYGWMIDDVMIYVCDSKAPVTTMNARSYSTDISKTSSFRVDWTATDPAPASGVKNYDVWVKSGATGTYSKWKSATTAKYGTYSGVAGRTYYFKALARDKVGHTGSVSAADKTIVPTDQSGGSYSSGWSGITSSSLYKGSAKYTKKAGASLSYSFSGNRISLIVTKGPGRGKAKVYVNGVYLKTVDTYSSTTKYRQPIFIKSWSTVGSRKIKVVNQGTSGRPRIEIDGLAAGK